MVKKCLNIDLTLFFQGAIATTLTQPLDVLKTRAMNAKPGDFRGPLDLVMFTAKQGPLAFYKVRCCILYILYSEGDSAFCTFIVVVYLQGYIPAFVRLGPQTIITFIFFEQLRKNFGFEIIVNKA